MYDITPGGKAGIGSSGRDYRPTRTYRRDTHQEQSMAAVKITAVPQTKREQILAALSAGPMTTRELCDYLDEPANNISSQVKGLRDMGKVISEEPRTGGPAVHRLTDGHDTPAPVAVAPTPLPAMPDPVPGETPEPVSYQPRPERLTSHSFDLSTPDGAAEALLAAARALAEQLRSSEARAERAEQQLAAIRAALGD